MRHLISTVPLFLFLFPLFLTISISNSVSQDGLVNYGDFVDVQKVEAHISFLTGLGSRVTGYPGCDKAAQYIYESFVSYGLLNVTFHEFDVTVPVDYGASFQLTDHPNMSFRIFPMAPNLVSPVTTDGIVAPVIYVGDGDLKDFDNKKVENSIILMNYNTGYNWINAAKLGAKAVIFIEPETTTYNEDRAKSLDIPFNFPRFYMPLSDANNLLKILSEKDTPPTVRITSFMRWEIRKGLNVLGMVRGLEQPDQYVILSAHYDSDSSVPSVAPGANDAVGIATLLELARFFSSHPSKYSILFVAFSGHHQSLLGSRCFVYDFFFRNPTVWAKNLILQLNLELSTISRSLVIGSLGDFYVRSIPLAYTESKFWKIAEYILDISSSIVKSLNLNFSVLSGYSGLLGYRFALGFKPTDAETLAVMLGPGISLQTLDEGNYVCSPVDTNAKLNFNNLKDQVTMVSCIIYSLLSTPNLKADYLSDFSYPQILAANARLIKGKAALYNKTRAWYDGVPGAIGSFYMQEMHFVKPFIFKTDDSGGFSLPLFTPYGWAFSMPFRILIYKLNDTTGDIEYAPTLGRYKYAEWILFASTLEVNVDIGFYTLFKSSTAILFDTIYPPIFGTVQMPRRIEILEHETQSPPEDYGYSMTTINSLGFSMAILYLPPGIPIDIQLTSPNLGQVPIGFLINASAQNLKGYGYKFGDMPQYIFRNTVLQFANNTYYREKEFALSLEKYQIAGDTQEINIEIYNLIVQAEEALRNHEYSKAYVLSTEAWKKAHYVFAAVREKTVDTVSTIIFFSLVLLPFTLLMNALLFEAKGMKQILTLITIFVAYLLFFNLLHPCFTLSLNPWMVVMGVSVIILISPLIFILFSSFIGAIKKMAKIYKGVHFAEISFGSAFLMSFEIGVRNLKRRKIRTCLTLFTVIALAASLILFTSISDIQYLRALRMIYPPTYQGVLIRHNDWNSIGSNIVEYVRIKYSNQAYILPRAWLYTINPTISISLTSFNVTFNDKSLKYYAALGLSADEFNLPMVRYALVDGRWFSPTDTWVCVLTYNQAKQLGVHVLDEVATLGEKFKVIGIVNGTYFDMIRDLDDQGITPWDRSIPEQFDIHVPSDLTFIVPYNTLLLFRPWISSVSIVPFNSSVTPLISENIFRIFDRFNIYVGSGNNTYFYDYGKSYVTLGWQLQIIPLITGCLIILNMMMGSVQERKKDILTYSAVGLSPRHVLLMFLCETIIYSVVGSVLGYGIALGFMRSILVLDLSTPFVKYSSTWVILPIMLIIAILLLSTLYPARLASRLVTPSLEKVWKVPTKPVGDEWTIPLPFIIAEDSEAQSLRSYLVEYLKTHGGEAEIFTAQGLATFEKPNLKGISMETRLAPYEKGIIQEVRVEFVRGTETEPWHVNLYLKRRAGERNMWIRLNRQFIDRLRKQFLMWRSLPLSERTKYERGLAK